MEERKLPMLSVVPIRLPARRPMDSINMYLVTTDPVTLIDAGFNTPETEAALSNALKNLNMTWHDIRRVLVTHTHPDHVGLAAMLENRCPADVYMHAQEWQKLQSGLADNIHLYRWAGIPDDYRTNSHPGHEARPPIPAWFKALNDGDQIPFSHGVLSILHTPGHCSGQVCLYEPRDRIMFTSDHLISNFSPALLVEPGVRGLMDRTPSLSQYQKSLTRLAELPVELAYPGHGQPFTNPLALIRRKLDYSIPEKLQRIHEYLTSQPQTVFDIVSRMIPELPPALAFFACGDTLAYLDQLAADRLAYFLIEQEQILFHI
jgi:glyoxylase-like metal-dependent hydrolase (beta-lactamase superfamily II)